MVNMTGDAPGDICNHARSQFIQLISKVKLSEFMEDFNEIARRVHSAEDSEGGFYAARGIKIHSLEVTRYQCANASTAGILEQVKWDTRTIGKLIITGDANRQRSGDPLPAEEKAMLLIKGTPVITTTDPPPSPLSLPHNNNNNNNNNRSSPRRRTG